MYQPLSVSNHFSSHHRARQDFWLRDKLQLRFPLLQLQIKVKKNWECRLSEQKQIERKTYQWLKRNWIVPLAQQLTAAFTFRQVLLAPVTRSRLVSATDWKPAVLLLVWQMTNWGLANFFLSIDLSFKRSQIMAATKSPIFRFRCRWIGITTYRFFFARFLFFHE